MLIYEIYREEWREYGGDIKKIIAAGAYIPRDDEFIRKAFNFGRGTMQDFKRYIENNRQYCKWYDAERGAFI